MASEIRARLSDEAKAAWERLCISEGVTITALIEALGRDLDEGGWTPSRRVFSEARRIDRARRSRG